MYPLTPPPNPSPSLRTRLRPLAEVAAAGLLIGVVAALQYLISAEILLTSVIMAAVGMLYLALRYRASLAERAGILARGLAAAIPAFLLMAAPSRRAAVHTHGGPDVQNRNPHHPPRPDRHPAQPPHLLAGPAPGHPATTITVPWWGDRTLHYEYA
jgi:hypothetical protein